MTAAQETNGDFQATKSYVGESCYLCEKKIKLGQKVKYYGGPFVIHVDCIQHMIDRRC